MTLPLEWTGWQQIRFCLECIPWGAAIGVLFDVNCGFIRAKISRVAAFLLDSLFGAVAACITFFCGLAIMDGQIHPLLLFGILTGFLLEHYTLGRLVSYALAKLVTGVRRLRRQCRAGVAFVCGKIVGRYGDFRRKIRETHPEEHKNRKNR